MTIKLPTRPQGFLAYKIKTCSPALEIGAKLARCHRLMVPLDALAANQIWVFLLLMDAHNGFALTGSFLERARRLNIQSFLGYIKPSEECSPSSVLFANPRALLALGLVPFGIGSFSKVFVAIRTID